MGRRTRTAAKAMAPGVISLSLHLTPAGLGPDLHLSDPPSDEGPNKITFNTYELSLVHHVANMIRGITYIHQSRVQE